MSIEDAIRLIERDRKERERGLLFWWLALAGRARRFVTRAIRIGVAWSGVLRSVFLGNQAIDQPGGVPFLSRVMADSHLAGYRRVGRLVDVRLDPPVTVRDLAPSFVPQATETLTRVAGSLETAIARGIADVVEVDRISADVAAVAGAFRTAGWSEESPRNAKVEATTVITQAYAGGMNDGLHTETMREVLSGLRFVNPLDARTTDICRKRHGVKLPLDDAWWFRSWPPLHAGCRSVVLPVTDRIAFTVNPPTFPPPDLGWGAWSGLLSSFTPIPR